MYQSLFPDVIVVLQLSSRTFLFVKKKNNNKMHMKVLGDNGPSSQQFSSIKEKQVLWTVCLAFFCKFFIVSNFKESNQ